MHYLVLVLLFASLGCGGDGASATSDAAPDLSDAGVEPDRSDEFFGNELIDIAITIPTSDWETLRQQYRSRVNLLGGVHCSATPPENVYDFFDASIDIDGQHYDDIAIRKKGYGSQSSRKPSLKVSLSKHVSGQDHLSVERFVINNNKSDDTNLRQCFSYRLMTAAGLPTPRCTFAKVSINGESLGVFSVVEEVKAPFLERHFGSSSGNLYEGESNDFRAAYIGFDQDNNEENDTTRIDLTHMRTVLETSTPETAIADIASLIDLEAFYRFWAAEVMIWHRDGYNGNLNNFFIYADPANGGRFAFIPWGTDNVMRDEARTTIPHSTLAFGIISNLLYRTTEGRTRFYEELDFLMATVWSEDELGTWIDEKSSLLEPHLRAVDLPYFQPQLDALRTTMMNRRQVFEDARADGEPDWEAGMRGEICRYERGVISGTIDAQWNTLYPTTDYTMGTSNISLMIVGETEPIAVSSGALSGLHNNGYDYIATYFDTADNHRYFFQFRLPVERFFDPVEVGVTMPLTSTAFYAGGNHRDLGTNTRIANFEIDEGTFHVTTFDKVDGGRVIISFDAILYER